MSLNTCLELHKMSKKVKGVLGIPDSIYRHDLSGELLVRVKSLYEDDQKS